MPQICFWGQVNPPSLASLWQPAQLDFEIFHMFHLQETTVSSKRHCICPSGRNLAGYSFSEWGKIKLNVPKLFEVLYCCIRLLHFFFFNLFMSFCCQLLVLSMSPVHKTVSGTHNSYSINVCWLNKWMKDECPFFFHNCCEWRTREKKSIKI